MRSLKPTLAIGPVGPMRISEMASSVGEVCGLTFIGPLIRSCAPRGVKGGAAMEESELRYRNARLKRKIDAATKKRPELEAVAAHSDVRRIAQPGEVAGRFSECA